MAFRNREGLKEAARQRLECAAYDPRKLMLVYTGVTTVVMVLVTVLNYVLTEQIAGTGGLGGLGTRAMLETVMQVLQTAFNFALPFWTMGYLSCALKIVRGQEFDLKDLLTGFKNFAPVIRLYFLYWVQFFILAFCCFYPSVLVFMITPLADPVNEILAQMPQDSLELVLDDATMAAITEAILPMFVIYGVMFLALAAPRFYNYRMAFYALLDDPRAGARVALGRSTMMMRGRKLDVLKLDLSFWWFYLLEVLTMALCYGEMILGWMGIQLPMDGEFAYYLFYGLYLAAQLGLYVWAKNGVECTYAAGYDALRREMEEPQQ